MAIVSGKQFLGNQPGEVVQSGGIGVKIPTKEERKSLFERSLADITKSGEQVQKAITGEGEFAGQTPTRRGVEATAEAFGAVPKVVGEVMPAWIKEAMKPIGELVKKGFNIPIEALSNTELFKEASKYPEYTKTLEEVLGTVAPVGEIAGTIAVAGTIKPTVDIAKIGVTKTIEAAKPIIEAGKIKTKSLFKRKVSSVDDIATQLDEGRSGGGGVRLYRGGTPFDIDKLSLKHGISFSTDKEMAQKFTKTSGSDRDVVGGVLEEVFLSPEARIAIVSDIPKDILSPRRLGLKTEAMDTELVKWAKDNGFDAIDMKGIKAIGIHRVEKEIRIINPDILKTSSKLPTQNTTNRDAVNTQIDALVNEGKTGEARALAESIAPQITFKEKLGGLRPDIKQRIQGKPELMQEYLDVVNTRNINDTAKSVIEHGGDYARKSADIMEKKLNEVGGDIGAFRQKVGTYKAPVSEVSRIEKTFSGELLKLNLEVKGNAIKQKAGTIARVNSEAEIKVLNELYNELQIIKQSPDLQRLIDFRNLFDSKINFAKSTRDVSSSLDPFSRVMRKDIADISAKIVGKSEAKNLTKYSEFMDALNQLKSFTDRKAGGEYLLRVVLSGRGGEARKVVQIIKEYTGIDLMDHATMMQVTNEMLGNAAQKTLFRQEMTNAGLDVASLLAGDPRGAAMTLFNKAIDRFINPEKILMEAAKSKP